MPSIMWFPGHLRPRKVWIDHALGGAARCRQSALRQRGIAAFDVVPLWPVSLQADRIVPAISLGQSRRCRQNRDGRQNRQSRNGASELPLRLTAQHQRIETDKPYWSQSIHIRALAREKRDA